MRLTVHFDFAYFNTGSAECLFILLKKLQNQDSGEMRVEGNCYYEEEDMMETWKDFNDFFDFQFNLVYVQSHP